MEKVKKIIISIIVIFVINFGLYFYPIYTTYFNYNDKVSNILLNKGNDTITYISDIFKSNIDQKYKSDVTNLLVINQKVGMEKSISCVKALVYLYSIVTISILAIGITILKKSEKYKYIGVALIITAIISALMCGLYSYSAYMINKL